MTAVVGRWQGLAGRHSHVVNEPDGAVDVVEDHILEVEAQVSESG